MKRRDQAQPAPWRAAAGRRSRGRASSTAAAGLRPTTIAQRQLIESIISSHKVAALKDRVDSLRASPRVSGTSGVIRAGHTVIQRVTTVMTLAGLRAPNDDDPIPVGTPIEDKERGLEILRQLGRGDRSAFAALNLHAPQDYAIQEHEWGLGHDTETGKYVIIRGGPGAVSFGKGVLAKVTGLSHTHPVPTGALSAEMRNETFPAMIEVAAMVGIDAVFQGYNSVFPSNADVIANYTVGSKAPEMLFTPYRLDGNGRFSAAQDAPFVSVQFGPATATLRENLSADVEENTAIDYLYAPIIVFRGDNPIWQGVLQVSTDRASSAWPKPIAVPHNARHRDDNRQIIDLQKRPNEIPSMDAVPRDMERADARERQPARVLAPEMERVMDPLPGKKTKKTKKMKEKKEKKEKGRCFITSACVHARGLADDCHELTVLRRFRDSFMRGTPAGAKLIAKYYRIAPGLVAGIEADLRCNEIFDGVYQRIVESVALIEYGDNEGALRNYSAMVYDLEVRYARSAIHNRRSRSGAVSAGAGPGAEGCPIRAAARRLQFLPLVRPHAEGNQLKQPPKHHVAE